jgi:hypothetical protein
MRANTYRNRLTRINNLSQKTDSTIHAELDENYPLLKILSPDALYYDYKACPFLMEMLAEDGSNKIILGPYGSGKTSGVIKWAQYRAVTMPVCDDGVRRYKITFIRNTTQDLQTTILLDWLVWCKGLPAPIGRKSTELAHNKEFIYHFNDKVGKIEMCALFLPLDSEDSERKLDSLQTTDIHIEEARHISRGIADKAEGRIGRYPPKTYFLNLAQAEFLKEHPDKVFDIENKEDETAYEWFKKWYPYKRYLISTSNAPSERHYIAEIEKQKPEGVKVYHQPPALIKNIDGQWVQNEKCDNVAYQAPDYWLKMVKKGEEYIRVYARGEYGLALEGKLVHPEFNPDLHLFENIEVDYDVPLIIGMDIGRATLAPGAMFAQIDRDGALKHLEEFILERGSTEALIENKLIPALNGRYAGLQLIVIGDPTGVMGKNCQYGEDLSAFEVVKRLLGVEVQPAKTNIISERINAQKKLLIRLVGEPAKPAFQVDKNRCPILVEALTYKYIYVSVKIAGEEGLKETPLKSHPHCESIDCSQYICCEVSGKGIRQPIAKLDSKQLIQSSYSNEVIF